MELFKWTDEYRLGIDSIDNDHKSLFNLLNEVFSAMKEGKARDLLVDVVDRLQSYAKNHFRREEFYFNTTAYPAMDSHKAEHDAFVSKIQEYVDELKNGNNTFTLEVVGFLREWLIRHIKGSDRAYKAHLQKYGIK